METNNRSVDQVNHWFDSLPVSMRKSLIRQFYHLYCSSSDGDLRTRVNTVIDKSPVLYDHAALALGEKVEGFNVMLKAKEEFKEYTNTIGA
jgi:hypothetical protein